MLLWALLLIFGLASRQASTADKAMVKLNPPWTTIFKGEEVTLTCHGSSSSKAGTTWWYKNQQLQKMWSTNSIETKQGGEYRCETQDSALSDPVNLVVSSDRLILQTPYSVFEGDTLVLRCQEKHNGKVKDMTFYKDGKKLPYSPKNSDIFISIPRVALSYSGNYHCTGDITYVPWGKSSTKVQLQVQELFSRPELKTTTSQPTEGTPMTLSCETQLPPQRSDTKLHFSFFRNGRDIASGWKESQIFQIPAIWREDTGSYWCEAKAMSQNIQKQSNHVKISVKRIPVSGIIMETQPPGGQVTEGEKLVFICSIAQGTGNITFSWHREGMKASLGEKIQRSLEEKFVLSALNESNAGTYYCTANNGIHTISSLRVNVTVKIPTRSQMDVAIVGMTVFLFSVFILIIAALMVYFKLLRKSGRSSAPSPYRVSPISNLQEPVYSNSSAQIELVPIYSNVNPVIKDIVYSELWSTQQEKTSKVNPTVENVVYSEISFKEHGKEANSTKNPPVDQDSSAFYTEVKKKD
ncbi:Fc receptor-like protein 4 isoform X2 [Petaurus breviceps papuanus]|uniref:Fc receptor-like protein 4 isoform X2 n=1 Tax=Petaurus breviceps papuanus TaxID=3040969 RepID=UPI0036DD016A